MKTGFEYHYLLCGLLIGSLFLGHNILETKPNANIVDPFPTYKVNKSIFKAFKKAKKDDLVQPEGFFILSIPNPYNKYSCSIINSSDVSWEKIGQDLLLKVDAAKFPKINSSIKKVIFPIISTYGCKKHQTGNISKYEKMIKDYLDGKYRNDSSIVILGGFSFRQVGHRDN